MENIEKLIGKVIQRGQNRYYVVDSKKIGNNVYCWTIDVTDLSIEEKEHKIFEVYSMSEDNQLLVAECKGEEYLTILTEFLNSQIIKYQEAMKEGNTQVTE